MIKRVGLYLKSEGMGDCLYAIPVIRKLYLENKDKLQFDVFSHHPTLFEKCPYVEKTYPIGDGSALSVYASANGVVTLFELDKLPHWRMDTFDFISIPLGLGTLSFREKRLEYFPSEPDQARSFDVVLNTSMTWPSRSWPLENWQRLAVRLVSAGLTVAVVGKDVRSNSDKMVKRAFPLQGCVDLTNKLSLDQTFFTLNKCSLFVTCQNGLSVLAGATNSEILVLDMSIEWCRRAIFRSSSPFHKVSYLKGKCDRYCCEANSCPIPENKGAFECQPTYEAVEMVVLNKVKSQIPRVDKDCS